MTIKGFPRDCSVSVILSYKGVLIGEEGTNILVVNKGLELKGKKERYIRGFVVVQMDFHKSGSYFDGFIKIL